MLALGFNSTARMYYKTYKHHGSVILFVMLCNKLGKILLNRKPTSFLTALSNHLFQYRSEATAFLLLAVFQLHRNMRYRNKIPLVLHLSFLSGQCVHLAQFNSGISDPARSQPPQGHSPGSLLPGSLHLHIFLIFFHGVCVSFDLSE